MTSTHYKNYRYIREQKIRNIGEGKMYAEFFVDRGHKDGAERHVLTTTGIIVVYNALTNRLVTKLIARPGQIRRYYPSGGAPVDILNLAYKHQLEKMNAF